MMGMKAAETPTGLDTAGLGPADAPHPTPTMAFVLYTRRGCPLCEEAEDIVAALVPGEATVIDVDSDAGLVRRFGHRVPVLAVVDALSGDIVPGTVAPGTIVPGGVVPGAVWMEGRFDEPLLARLLVSGGPAPGLRAPASNPGDRAGR